MHGSWGFLILLLLLQADALLSAVCSSVVLSPLCQRSSYLRTEILAGQAQHALLSIPVLTLAVGALLLSSSLISCTQHKHEMAPALEHLDAVGEGVLRGACKGTGNTKQLSCRLVSSVMSQLPHLPNKHNSFTHCIDASCNYSASETIIRLQVPEWRLRGPEPKHTVLLCLRPMLDSTIFQSLDCLLRTHGNQSKWASPNST